ncbi:MAG: M23 family metallopeptidase [Phenylobacterium sp.]|uniref:M23 family metallopeptidase n=1 Tax=Phenylobacterium sp. TaxID=1871053 RepID=UPI0025EA31EC|nr:M23 family metallopeptidase [Phenylobacterium sp.]MCG9917601.1 M23 family metallopeptidase [Phenylobacterium sp.]
MSETAIAPEGGLQRLGVMLFGAVLALSAITLAHAALPRPEARPEPEATFTPPPPARVFVAFQSPLPNHMINSPFGLRQMPWETHGRLHAGVDIAAPFGEPVLAAADGVVSRAGLWPGYGRMVEITHAGGLVTRYAHLGAVVPGLRRGHRLKAGTPLGEVGSTGVSSGPHLHFEIRDRDDRPLNPLYFLGRRFAQADDLPLDAAAQVSPRVRMAQVSNIPESKRSLMAARGLIETGD